MKQFEVYENNAGGLSLVVYNEETEKLEYIHTGYEFNPGQLSEDIAALKDGDDPAMMWDGNEIDCFTNLEINEFASGEFGKLVADNDAIYPENMGSSACIEFGIEK